MHLASDRSGRVPFSFAAVLILAGSIAAGAYMEQLGELRSQAGRGMTGPDIEAQLVVIKNDLASIARRDIELAVEAQQERGAPQGAGAMGAVDRSFGGRFKNDVEMNYRPPPMVDLKFNATVLSANLTAAPVLFRTMNRLGMMVEMAGAGALRALCAVELEIRPRGGPAQNRTVQVDVHSPSWYPFALSQAVRMRRDCAAEGLVELFVREQLEGYLERSIPVILLESYPSPLQPGSNHWGDHNFTPECSQAVSNALVMEELVLFGHASRSRLADHFSSDGGGRFRVASALPAYGSTDWNAPWTDEPREGELSLEMPMYWEPLKVYDDLNLSAPASFLFFPDSEWSEGPFVTVTKRLYAGEELREDAYSLELQVHGMYSLLLRPGDEKDGIRFDIPVGLDIEVDGRSRLPPFGCFEWGKDHCQMENLSLFESEFAGLYRAPVDLTLQLRNCSGIGLSSIPRPLSVEVSLDNAPLGLFGKSDIKMGGLQITRLPSGPHKFDVVLTYLDNGESEFGTAAGTFLDAGNELEIRTDRGPDTANFWSAVLSAIRNEPSQMRMTRMLELFANMTGFPFPPELTKTGDNSSAGVQLLIAWGQRFHRFLASSGSSAASEAPWGDWRDEMMSTVEVMLEASACIESVLASLEWDRAARSLAISALNITLKGFMETDGGASILEVYFQCGFTKATLRFQKTADGSKRWTLERPQQKDYKWTFDPLTRKDRASLAFEGAVDLAFIVCAACSLWTKYQRYQNSEGGLSQYETVDLSLDLAQLCLRIATMVTRTVARGLFQGVSEAAGKGIKVAGEAVAFAAGLLQMIQTVHDEIEHFEGDEAVWGSLFTTFDETTLTFYLTMASTIVSFVAVLATAGAAGVGGLAALACLAPFLGPIGAILALVTLIVMMIFNAEAIGCFLAGTATTEARDRTVSSVGGTLQYTLGTIASLNEYDADQMILESRLGRGAAFLLDGIGMFMTESVRGGEMENLSAFSYDMAWAREHQARSVRCLRYFLIVMWKQANDFKDADSATKGEPADLHSLPDKDTLGQNGDWHVDIKVTDQISGWSGHRLADGEIESFLLGMTSEKAGDAGVDFKLIITKGTVTSDGLKRWVDTIGRISDMVTVWQNRLAAAQAMSAYVSGLNGYSYRHDRGYLQLRLEDTYADATVSISSHDGKSFVHFTGKNEVRVQSALTVSINGTDKPRGIYLQPGRYDVEIIGHFPASQTSWKKRTVDVYSYYSPLFCSRALTVAPAAKPIFLRIDDRFNRTVELTVVSKDGDGNLKGTLCRQMRFNQSTVPKGKFYIDDSWIPGFNFDNSVGGETQEMKDSLTYSISITMWLDCSGDGKLDTKEDLEFSTSNIRNDHVRVMQAEESKHIDQLEYRLVIADSLLESIIHGMEGDYTVKQYLSWETVTKI